MESISSLIEIIRDHPFRSLSIAVMGIIIIATTIIILALRKKNTRSSTRPTDIENAEVSFEETK